MRNVREIDELQFLSERVLAHASDMGRTLPEMRFFVLNANEFASLLEKKVYPVSPVNIWEGKNMVSRRHRIEQGQESSIYYEVVQTGDPSYVYLNHTNNAMMQASVMAHVVGHCEFSELNVMQDSNPDRTEYVMHLVKKSGSRSLANG
jgi:stage V sporulation protein R